MGKASFESWIWDTAYIEVKHYHGDNRIFSLEEYWQVWIKKSRTQSFLGVGAQHQHQNARAECTIQTMMWIAWTFMVHFSLHWLDSWSDDISLWPFAIKHVVWLYKRVPIANLAWLCKDWKQSLRQTTVPLCACMGMSGYSPPTKLQNNQKLPKWYWHARVGQTKHKSYQLYLGNQMQT